MNDPGPLPIHPTRRPAELAARQPVHFGGPVPEHLVDLGSPTVPVDPSRVASAGACRPRRLPGCPRPGTPTERRSGSEASSVRGRV
jgi:hypothetical protein